MTSAATVMAMLAPDFLLSFIFLSYEMSLAQIGGGTATASYTPDCRRACVTLVQACGMRASRSFTTAL
jgi:hypothetical protein